MNWKRCYHRVVTIQYILGLGAALFATGGSLELVLDDIGINKDTTYLSLIAAFFSLALTTLNPAQYIGGFERAYRNLYVAITEYEIGVVENDKQAKRALVAVWRQCNEDVIFRSQDKNSGTRLDDEPEPARERQAQPG